MALSKSGMASEIVQRITAQNPDTNEEFITPYWEAICEGIIAHLKSNTVVEVTVTGVQAGSSQLTALGIVKE